MSRRYRKQIKRILENDIQGLKSDGHGANGYVYNLNKSRVFKVFDKDDTGYLDFLKLMKKFKGKKHFPRVYDFYPTKDEYIVVLERLQEYKNKDGLWDYTTEAESVGYGDADSGLWYGYFSKSFDKYLKVLEDNFTKGVEWDLHANNIMQREDGTPVIIDPWYG